MPCATQLWVKEYWKIQGYFMIFTYRNLKFWYIVYFKKLMRCKIISTNYSWWSAGLMCANWHPVLFLQDKSPIPSPSCGSLPQQELLNNNEIAVRYYTRCALGFLLVLIIYYLNSLLHRSNHSSRWCQTSKSRVQHYPIGRRWRNSQDAACLCF